MHAARILRSLVLAAPLSLAAVTATGAAAAASVTPGAATPVQREQAQSRFLRGRELYNAKKYEAALAEFNASLDIVASPNTRLYAGRCLREMGKLVAAYVELGRTAVEARELAREDPRYAKAGEAAEEERRQLEPKLGFIEISVSHAAPTTTLRVGDDEVRRGGWNEPVPVLPGSADVVVETPGHGPITRSVTIAAGERQSLTVDAEADAPDAPPAFATDDGAAKDEGRERAKLRPYAFAAAGVGAAGLATFALFGVLANGTHSDLESACGSGPCPPGHKDDISAGKTQQTIANIGLAFAVIGAATAVTLFVLDRRSSSSSASASSRVVARGSFLSLEGSF